MIADIKNDEKLYELVNELFIRGRKLTISLVFITQSHLKIPNKRELQHIAHNHASDIDFKVFTNLYKKFPAKITIFFSC